jgi:two-component system, NarL family, response regulator DevR
VPHIAIVSSSSLWRSGVAAALADDAHWQLSLHDSVDDIGSPACAVLQPRDAAESLRLHAALPATMPALFLCHDLRELAQRSAGHGRALALLPADVDAAPLRAAVAAVLQGLSVRAGPWQATLAGAAMTAPAPDHEPLTPRELEVFELVGKGLSNPDIAGVLGISAHTAKFHVGQILAKVGAATRAEAVSCGLKMGLIGL